MPLRSFLAVLRLPRVPLVLVSTMLGRLGRAASPLAIVLWVAEASGSYALAGGAAAVLTFTDAATAPFKARLVDRFGVATVLLPLAVGHALALVAVVGTGGTERVLLLGLVGAAGICTPPLSGSSKALWPSLVRSPNQLPTAYVVESALQQVLFFTGPVYVTVVRAVSSASTALVGVAVCTVVGTSLFVGTAAAVRRSERAVPTGPRTAYGALAVPVVVLVTVTTLLQSMVFGALGVALPALDPNLAGLLVACGPAGGLVGTVLLGARPVRQYAGLFMAIGVLLAPLPSGVVPLVALCAFLAGLLITPVAAITYQLVQRDAPAAVRTEAFTWLSTANASGTAAGSAVAGLAIDGLGLGHGLAVPTVAVLCAALVAYAFRSHVQQ